MKYLFGLILIVIGFIILAQYCESKKNPYEVGMHWNYSISCENGFIYKTLDKGKGTIQIFNSDGTPLRCGQKIY